MKILSRLVPRLVPPLAAALLLLTAVPAAARDDHDHDRAREALERGEILPLGTILQRLERDAPGQVMEVELERQDGQWLYELKLLRSGGSLIKLKVDARDGRILESRQRQHGAGPRRSEKP